MQQTVQESLVRLGVLSATPTVSLLATAFSAAGHELALVGGPVRDAFLGRECKDLDFTTDATPDEILAIVATLTKVHWDIGRAFGTIGARIAGETVEITTYRTDSYDQETRKPSVEFGQSLETDLCRRDFTVNALALRLPEMVLVDPSGGIEDLLAGILRTPTSPQISFGDDPLRMLRAVRFHAQLGLVPDQDTMAAMSSMAPSLAIVSAERIGDEIAKTMRTVNPRAGIELLVATGLADIVLPEVPALKLETDEHHHHKDVYEHSLTVLDQAIELERSRAASTDAEPDVVLRLAALLHDIGKPATKRNEAGGTVTFYHHDIVGSKLAKKRLRELRYDNDTINNVARLVELHLRFFGYTEGAWTDSAVRRYVRDAGPLLSRLHILTRADVTTRNKRKSDRLSFAYDDLEKRIAELAELEEMQSVRPDLDGEAIMALLQIRPGREVGEAYRFLLELRLDQGPLAAGEAEKRLLDWWAVRMLG